ncbi:hypothetical protein NFI96_013304 [Prochilodus magdalenae]|nr:hypothetical protein NFI96_013304 [Prochilodus magdalenae]
MLGAAPSPQHPRRRSRSPLKASLAYGTHTETQLFVVEHWMVYGTAGGS